jgi:TonB family protein
MLLGIFLAQLMALATAMPSPVPTSECFREATVVRPVPLDLTGLSRDLLAQPLRTEIEVTIEVDGTVKQTSVYKSSGYRAFDLAAERAARQSTYTPKIRDCKRTEGVYLFRAMTRP